MDEQVQFSVLGGRVVLVCDVDMNPWGQFEWTFEEGDVPSNVLLSDNVLTITTVETYNIGNYTCAAINEILGVTYHVEFGIELRLPGVPEPATNLTIKASTSVSVTLGWTCGHNGGDDNMWFELYIRNPGQEYEVYDDHIPADCATGERHVPGYRVSGLESATDYQFQIKSRNSFGWNAAVVPATVAVFTPGIAQNQYNYIVTL